MFQIFVNVAVRAFGTFSTGKPMPHQSEVRYYADDDGVWVECLNDEWEVNLGYSPSVEDIVAVWDAHILEDQGVK